MNCKYFNLDNGIERIPKRRINLAVLFYVCLSVSKLYWLKKL